LKQLSSSRHSELRVFVYFASFHQTLPYCLWALASCCTKKWEVGVDLLGAIKNTFSSILNFASGGAGLTGVAVSIPEALVAFADSQMLAKLKAEGEK
jgi:hypothetical protein